MIVITARLYIEEVTPNGLDAMMDQIMRATKEVASARADAIMQCGTPGVALKDAAYEEKVIATLEEVSGKPASTMATAVADALHHLQARRLAVATPYLAEVGTGVVHFLTARGFEVRATEHLGIRRMLTSVRSHRRPPINWERRWCKTQSTLMRSSSPVATSERLKSWRRWRKT